MFIPNREISEIKIELADASSGCSEMVSKSGPWPSQPLLMTNAWRLYSAIVGFALLAVVSRQQWPMKARDAGIFVRR